MFITKAAISAVYLVSGMVLILALSLYFCPTAVFPEENVIELASSYYGNQISCPMCGKIAIVTGATSGLGESVAFQMYKVY